MNCPICGDNTSRIGLNYHLELEHHYGTKEKIKLLFQLINDYVHEFPETGHKGGFKMITLKGYEETVKVNMIKDQYASNQRTVIRFVDQDGLPFMTLSVNLPEKEVPDKNHFWAKTWSENAPFRSQLLECGLFEDTGVRAQTGMMTAELWKLIDGPTTL